MGKKSDWMGTFGCCNNKELTYYYCIGCKSIQHRSCVERKNFITVKGYKIFCSKKCEDNSLGDCTETEIELVQELRHIIADLNSEWKHACIALERKQRNSTAFEIDVEEAEKRYTEEMTKQQEQINTLQGKLIEEISKRENETKNIKQQSEEKESEHKSTIQTLKQNLKEQKEAYDEKQKQKDLTIEQLNDHIESLTIQLSDEVRKRRELEQTYETLKNKLSVNAEQQKLENEHNHHGEKENIINARTEAADSDDIIKEYRCRITRLEEQLKDLCGKRLIEKEFHSKDTGKYREEIKELKRRMDRTKLMNNSLQKSIETMEKENKDLKSKLKLMGTKGKVEQTKETTETGNHKHLLAQPDTFSQIQSSTNRRVQTDAYRNRKSQILILGGKTEYNYGKILKKISQNRFDTNCQHNENSNNLEDIIKNHEILTRQFNKSDYKIILTHHENARQGIKVTTNLLEKLINSSQNTNTIIVGSAIVPGKTGLSQVIKQHNNDLEKYVRDLKDVTYIDSNKILKPYEIEDGNKTGKGKWKLAKYIYTHCIQAISRATQTDTKTPRNLDKENQITETVIYQEALSPLGEIPSTHISTSTKNSENKSFLWPNPSLTSTTK